MYRQRYSYSYNCKIEGYTNCGGSRFYRLPMLAFNLLVIVCLMPVMPSVMTDLVYSIISHEKFISNFTSL